MSSRKRVVPPPGRARRAPARSENLLTRMRRDLDAFRARHPELLASAGGRFALIEDGVVRGAFDSSDDALARARRREGSLVVEITETLPPPHWIFVTPRAPSERNGRD